MNNVTKRTPKNLRWYMRYLHNKLGFFFVGMVIIYSLSGIIQIYRDTDFLKHDVVNEKELAPGLTVETLGPALRLRDFSITRSTPDTLFFKEGNYAIATGKTSVTSREWYGWIKPFTELHKATSKSPAHYFTTIFGIALFFLSISAFWMFKPGTKLFSSGVMLSIAGIVAAILFVLFA